MGKCFEKSVGVQAMDSEWSNDLVTHWEDPHFMGNQELTIYYIGDQDLLKGTQFKQPRENTLRNL